jgi:hypothetical protein
MKLTALVLILILSLSFMISGDEKKEIKYDRTKEKIIEEKTLKPVSLTQEDFYVHEGMLVFRKSLIGNWISTGGNQWISVYINTVPFVVDVKGLKFPIKKIIATCSLGHFTDSDRGGRWALEILDTDLEWNAIDKKWYIRIKFKIRVAGITGIVWQIHFFGIVFGKAK